MKKLFFVALFASALFTFSSCTKSKSDPAIPLPLGTTGQWTVNGITNMGNAIGSALSGNTLVVSDATAITPQSSNAKNLIQIVFGSKPMAAAYTVVNQITLDTASLTLNASQCSLVAVSGIGSANEQEFESAGKAGDIVTVTVTGGKVTATFSNISVFVISSSTNTITTATTVSGNIIQP